MIIWLIYLLFWKNPYITGYVNLRQVKFIKVIRLLFSSSLIFDESDVITEMDSIGNITVWSINKCNSKEVLQM